MSGLHSLPPNPLLHPNHSPSRDPSPPPRGFSRSGFAPIPYRHSELPPPPREREREFPRRDLDPEPEIERWERRMDREDWDRRAPPPHMHSYEDNYDRPKRRRSPSPIPPSHRPRLRSPSPPRFPPPPSHNLPDPASVDTLLTFRQFAEWFRASHPQTAKVDEEELRRVREQLESGSAPDGIGRERVGMGKRYERYRQEYTSRQLFALYLSHRAMPWFQERYSALSTFTAQRRRINRQGRVPTAERYLDALRAGEHDEVNFDLTDKSEKQQSEKAEPEGLDRALGEDHVANDPLRVEIAPRDRQVFVKTVTPSASRKELEGLFSQADGFEYLALTEPATKKSFHRVAWAQFASGKDVEAVVRQLDGQRIDNFTFHMGVNATPIVGKTRVTQPIANSLDRLVLDCEKAKALAMKLEEELLGDDEDGVQPEGEDSEPKLPGLRERGSVMIEETTARILAKHELDEEELNEEQRVRRAKITLDQWVSYLRHGLSTCYYCVAPMSFAEELHRKCISHMRPHPDAKSEVEPVPEGNGEMIGEEKRDEDREDADMREAEDGAKAEVKEAQAPRRNLFPPKSQEEKWAEVLDTKIKPLLGEVDVVEYGGRDIEEESRKLCAPLIKQEEASKYRCKECNKLFKAPEFVIKHIAVKHPEITNAKIEEFSTLNNFVLDPQHIQPTSTTPAAVNDRILAPVQPSLPPHQQNYPMGAPMFNPSFNGNSGNGPMNNGQPGMNLAQQQMMMMMQMQQAMLMGMTGNGGAGGQGRGLAERVGGFADAPPMPLPPPPAGGEDPRAKRGRVSYRDLDEPGGGGDGGLPY